MSKYDPLTRYLKNTEDDIIRLTFEEIEDIPRSTAFAFGENIQSDVGQFLKPLVQVLGSGRFQSQPRKLRRRKVCRVHKA